MSHHVFRRQDTFNCPNGQQYYRCSQGSYEGCCSFDPCTSGRCVTDGNLLGVKKSTFSENFVTTTATAVLTRIDLSSNTAATEDNTNSPTDAISGTSYSTSKLASATNSSATSIRPSPTAATSGRQAGSSAGSVVGIVLGCLGALALVIGCAFFFYRKKKSQKLKFKLKFGRENKAKKDDDKKKQEEHTLRFVDDNDRCLNRNVNNTAVFGLANLADNNENDRRGAFSAPSTAYTDPYRQQTSSALNPTYYTPEQNNNSTMRNKVDRAIEVTREQARIKALAVLTGESVTAANKPTSPPAAQSPSSFRGYRHGGPYPGVNQSPSSPAPAVMLQPTVYNPSAQNQATGNGNGSGHEYVQDGAPTPVPAQHQVGVSRLGPDGTVVPPWKELYDSNLHGKQKVTWL